MLLKRSSAPWKITGGGQPKQGQQQQDSRNPEDHRQRDSCPGERLVACGLAGLAVEHEAVELVAVSVAQQVDRQEDPIRVDLAELRADVKLPLGVARQRRGYVLLLAAVEFLLAG